MFKNIFVLVCFSVCLLLMTGVKQLQEDFDGNKVYTTEDKDIALKDPSGYDHFMVIRKLITHL